MPSLTITGYQLDPDSTANAFDIASFDFDFGLDSLLSMRAFLVHAAFSAIGFAWEIELDAPGLTLIAWDREAGNGGLEVDIVHDIVFEVEYRVTKPSSLKDSN
ncbi:hypothetical protein CEP54_008076 [Fusarium duplospermum]|uniref:Uncharacterized protein n=1 Tax=Fusarium duplospermum TaxID=1325734 RepID=A0A428PXU3_9HYPO|nr:hypothetical protein CEP54_008076 [Fusarium duplospermum]